MKSQIISHVVLMSSILALSFSCKYQDNSRPSKGVAEAIQEVLPSTAKVKTVGSEKKLNKKTDLFETKLSDFYNKYILSNHNGTKVMIDSEGIHRDESEVQSLLQMFIEYSGSVDQTKEYLAFLINGHNFHSVVFRAQIKNEVSLDSSEVVLGGQSFTLNTLKDEILKLAQDLYKNESVLKLISTEGQKVDFIAERFISTEKLEQELNK